MKNYCRDLGKNICWANYQYSGKVCVCVWRGHLPAICHFLLTSEVGVGPSCSLISASPPQFGVGSSRIGHLQWRAAARPGPAPGCRSPTWQP